jgi:monoamine oxidase
LGEPAADTSAPILAADQVKAVRGAASDEIRLSKNHPQTKGQRTRRSVIPRALADGLEVRVGTTVTRIDHNGADVSVVTDRGTFDGDRAIVTVPLGVLRAGAVTFDPPLDRAHSSAVDRLEMGTEEKVVFRFSERFWPESVWETWCAVQREAVFDIRR